LTLLFKRRFIPHILAGEKTQTRRPSKPGVREGGTYTLREGYLPTPHRITVTRVYTQRLGDVSQEDARTEGFGSLGEFMEAWAGIYGSWSPDRAVYVVEFRLEGVTEMFKEKTGAS
jgi:hypothetical protein